MYLICDLDNTFLKKDYFKRCFFRHLLFNPLQIISVFNSNKLISLKHRLLDDFIPQKVSEAVNQLVLELLKQEKVNFEKVILISASTQQFVDNLKSKVSDFEVFDKVYGSQNVNLKGINKLAFIKEKGFTPFVYLGDSKADKPIFKASKYYYKVKANKVEKLINSNNHPQKQIYFKK